MKTTDRLRRAAPWACAWALAAPLAQAADPPTPDPAAAVFDHYRAWREPVRMDWRAANDREGGLDTTAPTPDALPAAPAEATPPADHDHHRHQ